MNFLFKFILFSIFSKCQCTTLTVKEGGSIQNAINDAMPGDTVKISDGTYFEDLKTVRDGEKDKRITITGSRKAILQSGGKEGRLFQIHHDYITVNGFTIDGQIGDGSKEEHFTDKLLYAHGNRKTRVIHQYGKEFRSAIDGLVVSNMVLKNAGGECSRLRYFITNAEYYGNRVENCGVHDFVFGGMKSVNGEVLYIGTSSNQWNDGKNPTPEDGSRYIHVHHNVFEGKSNELDVKEGTEYVLVEYNKCSTQKDVNSACLDSRTDNIIFRYNEVYDNDGAGVRIGGHTIDGHTFGQKNEVYGNTFFNNKNGALVVQTGPHHCICDNKCKGDCKTKGSVSDDHKDIESKCSGNMDIYWIDGTKAENVENVENVELESEGEDGPEISGTIKKVTETCNPLSVSKIDASSDDGKNTASLAIDGGALTRWSSNGKGEWIELTLSYESSISSVEISFYKGDQRYQIFDIYIDGNTILENQKSSGKTLSLENFPFKKEVVGKSLTLIGNGNSENNWNSISEMIICGTSSGEQEHDEPEKTIDKCTEVNKLVVESAEGSSDGNKPSNVLDGNLKTRWSSEGEEQELILKLEKTSSVSEIGIAIHNGEYRQALFDLLVNTNGEWLEVIVDGVSKPGNGIQSYDVDVEKVDIIKYVGYGNNDIETGKHSLWNSISQIEIYGC